MGAGFNRVVTSAGHVYPFFIGDGGLGAFAFVGFGWSGGVEDVGGGRA